MCRCGTGGILWKSSIFLEGASAEWNPCCQGKWCCSGSNVWRRLDHYRLGRKWQQDNSQTKTQFSNIPLRRLHLSETFKNCRCLEDVSSLTGHVLRLTRSDRSKALAGPSQTCQTRVISVHRMRQPSLINFASISSPTCTGWRVLKRTDWQETSQPKLPKSLSANPCKTYPKKYRKIAPHSWLSP